MGCRTWLNWLTRVALMPPSEQRLYYSRIESAGAHGFIGLLV